MLRLLGVLALLLVLGIAGLFAVAATRPDSFQVSRTLPVQAPPEKVYPLINDLRAFNSWNPFVRSDPAPQLSYSGPASGPGARNAFGPGKGGTGTLTIVEAEAPTKVVMSLDMTQPMAARNRVVFSLEPQGGMTLVTWTLAGNTPLVGKVLHLVIDMDKMVGGQFEAGLADLKALAEK